MSSCHCAGAGFLVPDVPYGHPDFAKLIPCICTQAARKDKQASAHAGILAQLKREMGRLAGCTFATFKVGRPLGRAVTVDGTSVGLAQQRQSLIAALAQATRFAEQPTGWLYLHGPVGSGKSHLAAAVAHTAATAGIRTAYTTAGGLMSFLRGGFVDHSVEQRISSLQDVPLLILDDLGTERAGNSSGSWAYEQLFEILNSRYLNERAMVITSNLPPAQALDERLADRVIGMGLVAEVLASSYRAIERAA